MGPHMKIRVGIWKLTGNAKRNKDINGIGKGQ